MSSYLSYTRGIRDKPIDTVAAVYFLQLSIADFVFWGLHLLIQTNNNLLSISVAKGVKVFILDGTIFIAGITERCYVLCVSVCLCMYIYMHFNIHLTSNFGSMYIFAQELKILILYVNCDYLHLLEYTLTDTHYSPNTVF